MEQLFQSIHICISSPTVYSADARLGMFLQADKISIFIVKDSTPGPHAIIHRETSMYV